MGLLRSLRAALLWKCHLVGPGESGITTDNIPRGLALLAAAVPREWCVTPKLAGLAHQHQLVLSCSGTFFCLFGEVRWHYGVVIQLD